MLGAPKALKVTLDFRNIFVRPKDVFSVTPARFDVLRGLLPGRIAKCHKVKFRQNAVASTL